MPLTSYEKHLFSEKWLDAVKDFDCCASKNDNYEKLNDFIKKDALKYNQNNLSRTNILVKNGVCIAYYSLAMNAIKEQRISVEEEYKTLKSYPALFLTRFAVDKRYQKSGIGKAILNAIVKNACENQEIAARFLFLDAYPESISWYLSNPLFEILYTALSERIAYCCEKCVIEKLNERLRQGHTIECELNEKTDVDTLRTNCEKILTTHVNDIFHDLVPENSLLKACHSKIGLTFENNKPKIKLEGFNTRQNLSIIRDWLKNKNNVLNLDITVPLYADINQYYIAIYG
ncbi:MAG: GNAT family N-acetyltransferase [Candidatus Methanoperedens sp.]|nr:GNAT family N-acetyltransferase [Candidatus Methanoperedens sp.]